MSSLRKEGASPSPLVVQEVNCFIQCIILSCLIHYYVPGMAGSANDATASSRINLPSGIFSSLMESRQSSTASLAFTAYQDSSLFPLPPSATRHPNFQIASPVIGASIIGQTISQNVSVFLEINQVIILCA